jgi:hypothetical protein
MAWTPSFEDIIVCWVFLSAVMKLPVSYEMDNLSVSRATVAVQDWICPIQ